MFHLVKGNWILRGGEFSPHSCIMLTKYSRLFSVHGKCAWLLGWFVAGTFRKN